MRRFIWAALLAASLLAGRGVAQASFCPFCPPSSPTLAEQLAESDVAVLVQWKSIRFEPQTEMAETTLQVAEKLRGPDSVAKGADVTLPFGRDGQPGDLFVLFGRRSGDVTDWMLVQEVTETLYHYIRQAPSPERPARERLQFFLKCLESSNQDIATDAFAEFSRASYADVAALALELPRDKIRQWLRGPQELGMQARAGFYGLLLGMCGDESDAVWLEREILRQPKANETRLGIDGMMGGYLLLRGRDGLARIREAKLERPETPASEVFAVLNTLRFCWDFGPPTIPRDDLKSCLRLISRRYDMAEGVVADLSRWKDWDALSELVERFGRPPFADNSGKQKLVQFAQACVKDLTANPDAATRPRLEEAKAFLKDVESREPALLERPRGVLPR